MSSIIYLYSTLNGRKRYGVDVVHNLPVFKMNGKRYGVHVVHDLPVFSNEWEEVWSTCRP